MGNVYRRGETKTKYIVRFDDLCPTMNWDVWNEIVQILDTYQVKPIVAVIPDNKDATLKYEKANSNFWDHIRSCQEKGWMIAMHGFNHVYTNHSSGLMGISANSEFATLPYELQYEKIQKGIEIFEKEGVKVDAFIAPSHSFDSTTLDVLRENKIRVISDGHTSYAYVDDGLLWIPCQLWDYFSAKRSGLYTVCYHHNTWSADKIKLFKNDVKAHITQIITPFSIKEAKGISWRGKCLTRLIRWKFQIKRVIKRILGIR